MIELTWAQLNEAPFVKAMVSLHNSRKLDAKTAYRVGRIFQTARKEMEEARRIETSLRNEYVAQDPDGNHIWKDDQAEKTFSEKLSKEFESHKACIKVHKLQFESLSSCELTPEEIVALSPIVEGYPDEEE